MDIAKWERLSTKDGYQPVGRKAFDRGEVYVSERIGIIDPYAAVEVKRVPHIEVFYAIEGKIRGKHTMDVAQKIVMPLRQYPTQKSRINHAAKIANMFMEQGERAGRYVQ